MYKRYYKKKKPRDSKTTVEFSCLPRQLNHYVGILVPNRIVENLQLNTRRKWKIAVSKNRLQLKMPRPRPQAWGSSRRFSRNF